MFQHCGMWKLGGDSGLFLKREGADGIQLRVWLELSVAQGEQQSREELCVSQEDWGGPGLEVNLEEMSETSVPG